jgi:carboxymethylenebutenolidase
MYQHARNKNLSWIERVIVHMDRVYVMQLVRSFQCGYLSRREFLQRASLVVGSTAAASLLAACGVAPTAPVPPPVVAPPAEPRPARPMGMGEGVGIIDANVRYGEGDALMGYLARSMDNTGRNAVIVIQEWWGLNDHIRNVTRRFADQGFVALAPDLYNGVTTTEPDEARKLVMELDMMQAVEEIGQAAEFLLEQDYVIGAKVGVVGFCMGGGLALQTALNKADVIGAAVAFYGRPLEAGDAARMTVPTLGLYGAEDQGIPVEAVRAMEQGFVAADIPHEIRIYPGAGHAFFNDERASYKSAAARDAWDRTNLWFRTFLQDV